MPYGPEDAQKHNKKANTPKLQRQWSDVFNSALKRTGDEATALKEANGVVNRAHGRTKRVEAVSRMRRRSRSRPSA